MGRRKRLVGRAESGKEAETKAQRGWQSGNRCGAEKAMGGEEGRECWGDYGK
jgi:hypothetical protein